MDNIITLLSYASTTVFLVTFIRALPWPEAWLARRPLSCDACMVGWAFALVLWPLTWDFDKMPLALGAGGLALLALRWYRGQGAALPPPPSDS